MSTGKFASDVRLIFRNARRYNREGSPLYASASRLSKIFETLLGRWVVDPWRADKYVCP
ncbi:unnamed protein product [Discosporangium mesarthrocarpum]